MKTDRTDFASLQRGLLIGLVAAVVTVLLGELPIGWVVMPQADDPVVAMLQAYAALQPWQLALGVLFGGTCIPLHAYGFEAVARLAQHSGRRHSAAVIRVGARACAFMGGAVHILCVALMFVCRLYPAHSMAALPQPVLDFALWLVLPTCAVFMPLYYAMTVAMLLCMLRGCTPLPRYAAVFNPLLPALVLNALPMFAPNVPLVNALNMASMGVGSVWTFAGLCLLMRRAAANR